MFALKALFKPARWAERAWLPTRVQEPDTLMLGDEELPGAQWNFDSLETLPAALTAAPRAR